MLTHVFAIAGEDVWLTLDRIQISNPIEVPLKDIFDDNQLSTMGSVQAYNRAVAGNAVGIGGRYFDVVISPETRNRNLVTFEIVSGGRVYSDFLTGNPLVYTPDPEISTVLTNILIKGERTIEEIIGTLLTGHPTSRRKVYRVPRGALIAWMVYDQTVTDAITEYRIDPTRTKILPTGVRHSLTATGRGSLRKISESK